MTDEYVIETRGLTKVFGAKRAVDDLNLQVRRGSVFGFLGPNGAGKTTTIKMLLGLTKPTSGEARVLGLDVRERSVEVRRRVGVVAEDAPLYDHMTVAETLAFASRLAADWDDQRAAKYMDIFRLPMQARVRDLSRGMRGQLALILALTPEPELLILDEPTAGLDPVMRREFLSTVLDEVTARGGTVFMSSHVLAEVERVADTVGIINKGKLLMVKDMTELKETEKKVRVHFQVEPDPAIFQHPGIASVEGQGRRYIVTVTSDLEGVLERLRTVPHFVIDVVDLNLEEIFMQYTGGKSGVRIQ